MTTTANSQSIARRDVSPQSPIQQTSGAIMSVRSSDHSAILLDSGQCAVGTIAKILKAAPNRQGSCANGESSRVPRGSLDQVLTGAHPASPGAEDLRSGDLLTPESNLPEPRPLCTCRGTGGLLSSKGPSPAVQKEVSHETERERSGDLSSSSSGNGGRWRCGSEYLRGSCLCQGRLSGAYYHQDAEHVGRGNGWLHQV